MDLFNFYRTGKKLTNNFAMNSGSSMVTRDHPCFKCWVGIEESGVEQFLEFCWLL